MKLKMILMVCLFMNLLNAATLQTNKDSYTPDENITVTALAMSGDVKDWIAIYPAGSTNDWENVQSWDFTGGFIDGNMNFANIPAGSYEVRAFFQNTFDLEASHAFSVEEVAVPPAIITTNKESYTPNESIVVNFQNMSANPQDWIAIYPAGSTTEWVNMIAWTFINSEVNGTHTFNALPAGSYEARAFFDNSFNMESSHTFLVEEEVVVPDASIITDKETYTSDENITVSFQNMSADSQDWIAIYPAGSTTEWVNMIAWTFINSEVNGTHTFNALPAGSYEARAFFDNSFDIEASHAFMVEEIINNETNLTSNKSTYLPNEIIYVNFSNMLGDPQDWIAVYPAGAANGWDNIITWNFTNGEVNGEFALEDGLPDGSYDLRAYFDGGLGAEAEAQVTINVVNQAVVSTVYEDAEAGISPDWVKVSGNYNPTRANVGFESTGTLVLTPDWINNTTNISEYSLSLNTNNTQKILEMDMGGLPNYRLPNLSRDGYIPHYSVGVTVQTTNGVRRMIWDSFFNHGNVQPFIKDYGNGNIWLAYPSPVEHVRGWYADIHLWTHFKVNVERELRKLEPNNKIISIDIFNATGGFLDNLRLSSH